MHHFLLGKGKRPGKDEINLPDKRELEKKHTDTHTHTHTHAHTHTHTHTRTHARTPPPFFACSGSLRRSLSRSFIRCDIDPRESAASRWLGAAQMAVSSL